METIELNRNRTRVTVVPLANPAARRTQSGSDYERSAPAGRRSSARAFARVRLPRHAFKDAFATCSTRARRGVQFCKVGTPIEMLRVALPFGAKTPGAKRDSYRGALRNAGIEPVEDITDLGELRGLLLAGGTDIAPDRYGAARQSETDESDGPRDELEIALVEEALARDLPVLAICRGLQLLNVAMGGTLVQHIEGHRFPKQREVHAIAVAPESRLASILGTHDYIVNSRHHQSVDRVGSGLRVAAIAPDGVIEALELPEKRFVLAVQWHPEARTDGPDAKLFEAFREALETEQDFPARLVAM